MSYNWNNTFTSKDDLNANRSTYNQKNYGINSASKLHSNTGFQPGWNMNAGTGFVRGSNMPVLSDEQRIEQVYKKGSYGVNNFHKTSFEEFNNGKLEKCLLTTIVASDDFQGLTVEELRYVDYRIKKQMINPNKQFDTPQFNKVGGMNNIVTNVINGTGNSSTINGKLGNFTVNRNNIGLHNNNNVNFNNNDLNPYLRPNSTSFSHTNTGITNSNTNLTNSFSATSTVNKFNANHLGTGNVSIQNNSNNQIGNNAFTKISLPNNINNFGVNGGSSNPAVGNMNKSLANYFDTTGKDVFSRNVNTANEPIGVNNMTRGISTNNNNNFVINNSLNNPTNPFGKNQTTNNNPIPLGSANTSTAFNNNNSNNFIHTTGHNNNIGSTTGILTPQNRFNFAITQNTLTNNNMPVNNQNNFNNNINPSTSLPFASSTNFTPQNVNSIHNLNFSTPSQNTINIGMESNQNLMNPAQNVRFGNTNNSFPYNQISNNHIRNQFIGNNSSSLTFKSNFSNINNITFNNAYGPNNNFNQTKSLNAINEVLTRFHSNDDYLGISSICQEVNNNLNNNFKFSKRELEEILDFSSLDNKNNKPSTKISGSFPTARNNLLSSIKVNNEIKEREKNSNKSILFNNPLNTNQKSLDRNNKENFYSFIRGGLLSTMQKPLDKPLSKPDEEIRERGSSRDSENQNSSTFKAPHNTIKKTLTIKDILPMNNNKPIKENNLLEKVDNLEDKTNNGMDILKTFKKNQTESKIQNLNYYKTHEFLNEIEKMAEEAHQKSVGPISHSGSTAQKISSVFQSDNKLFSLSHNKNFFQTDSKFSKKKNSTNVIFKPNKMNTILETKEETDGNFYDINALDFPESIKLKKTSEPENNLLSVDYIHDTGILNLKFKIFTPINYEFNIKINKKNKVIDLRRAIEELLKDKFPHDFQNSSTDSIVIFTKNGVLKDQDVIESKSFVNEYEVINVFTVDESNIHEIDSDSKFSNKENFNYMNEQNKELEGVEISSINSEFEGFLNDPFDKNRETNENLAENLENSKYSKNFTQRPEYCPITQKFKTDPPYYELVKIPKEKLENLKNFSVFNEHGKILFKNATDVTYLDLDEIVNISPLYVDVYQHVKPPKVGEKLNKDARIFIYNLEIPNEARNSDEAFSEFIMHIKNNLSEQNAQFVHFDQVKSELIFDVKSFERK